MGVSCGSNANGENDGYSRLDLVKHTLNTIIHSLTSEDELCIISFSTVAQIFAPRTKLTAANKELLQARVKNLEPDGQTNIWDSLRLAIENIATIREPHVKTEIYLLTDGEPNINPPGDLVETVSKYLERTCAGRFPVINTFGYGYSLDSQMLYNMARLSNGIFGFIPDSTMVGTVFINALSASIVGDGSRVNPTCPNDVVERFVEVLAELMKPPEASTGEVHKATRLRDFVSGYLEVQPAGGPFLADLIDDCKESPDKNRGQVAKAVEDAFFEKWGCHYLRSVKSAFESRVCINFKDRAIQHFKSALFATEQERIEAVFTALPPPRPSERVAARNYHGSMGLGATSPPATPRDMAGYYNASGGCFTGDSKVFVWKGSALHETEFHRLRKGDLVQCLTAMDPSRGERRWRWSLGTVECVVKLRYRGPIYEERGDASTKGPMLTAYHPVSRLRGDAGMMDDLCDGEIAAASFFPVERGWTEDAVFDGYVYDVVLKERGLIRCCLGGEGEGLLEQVMVAATFGHGCEAGQFLHHYFGSEQVIRDLQAHVGWPGGWVELDEYSYVREPTHGLVTKMMFQEAQIF